MKKIEVIEGEEQSIEEKLEVIRNKINEMIEHIEVLEEILEKRIL